MKNRRNIIIAGVGIAIAALLVWVYWPRKIEVITSSKVATEKSSPSQPTPSLASPPPSAVPPVVAATPSQAEIDARKEIEIRALYQTPISVYGKVIDEVGHPISGATVEIGIADKPLETGSKHTQTTSSDGTFSLTDVRGIAFSLRASKSGYYTTDESRARRNVVTPAVSDIPQPLANQMVVLVLRKQGLTAQLITVRSGQIIVPKTGQAVNVDLTTGRPGQNGLQMSSWVGDATQRRFDWRLRVAVPGGGLIERKDEFKFEAPSDGYQEAIEINMAGADEQWSSDVTKEYFAKLADGRYARFSINFYPGRRNFVVIESYINPASGSRNLEAASGQP